MAGRTRTSLDIMRGLERVTLSSSIGEIEAAERAALFSSIRLLRVGWGVDRRSLKRSAASIATRIR